MRHAREVLQAGKSGAQELVELASSVRKAIEAEEDMLVTGTMQSGERIVELSSFESIENSIALLQATSGTRKPHQKLQTSP